MCILSNLDVFRHYFFKYCFCNFFLSLLLLRRTWCVYWSALWVSLPGRSLLNPTYNGKGRTSQSIKPRGMENSGQRSHIQGAELGYPGTFSLFRVDESWNVYLVYFRILHTSICCSSPSLLFYNKVGWGFLFVCF